MTEKSKEVEVLMNSNVALHGIIQHMEGVVHPRFIEALTKMQAEIEEVLKPHYAAENDAWEKEQEKINKIQEENKIRSIWSVSKVKSDDMNKKTPEISEIIYESWGPTQVHKFDKPKKITWLDFWKIADELIMKSGDDHHVFVEGISPVKGKPGVYKMYTGS